MHHLVVRMRMVERGEEARNSLVLRAEGKLLVITMIWIIEVSENVQFKINLHLAVPKYCVGDPVF
jgi:hypothetical protein